MEIKILSNAKQVSRAMSDLAYKQLPFATAVALTKTAVQSARIAKEDMGHRFQLKNKWTQKGVQIERAEKRDWPHIQAAVGIDEKRAYIADHEEGHIRKGQRGHRLAVPSSNIRRTKTGKIPKGQRVRAIREKKGFIPKGSRTVFVRKGRGRKKRMLPLYFLGPSIRIRKKLGFVRVVTQEIQRRYHRTFKVQFDKAVASAKTRAGVR